MVQQPYGLGCVRPNRQLKKRKNGRKNKKGEKVKQELHSGNWDMQARINLTHQLDGMPKPSIRLPHPFAWHRIIRWTQCTSVLLRETDNTDIWEAFQVTRSPTQPPATKKARQGSPNYKTLSPTNQPTSLSTQSTKRHKSTAAQWADKKEQILRIYESRVETTGRPNWGGLKGQDQKLE